MGENYANDIAYMTNQVFSGYDAETQQLNSSIARFLKLERTLVSSFARLEVSKKFLQLFEFFPPFI